MLHLIHIMFCTVAKKMIQKAHKQVYTYHSYPVFSKNWNSRVCYFHTWRSHLASQLIPINNWWTSGFPGSPPLWIVGDHGGEQQPLCQWWQAAGRTDSFACRRSWGIQSRLLLTITKKGCHCCTASNPPAATVSSKWGRGALSKWGLVYYRWGVRPRKLHHNDAYGWSYPYRFFLISLNPPVFVENTTSCPGHFHKLFCIVQSTSLDSLGSLFTLKGCVC